MHVGGWAGRGDPHPAPALVDNNTHPHSATRVPSPLCNHSGRTSPKNMLGPLWGSGEALGRGQRDGPWLGGWGPPGKAGAGAKPPKQPGTPPRGAFWGWKVPSCLGGRLFLSLWVFVTCSTSSPGGRRGQVSHGGGAGGGHCGISPCLGQRCPANAPSYPYSGMGAHEVWDESPPPQPSLPGAGDTLVKHH